MPSSISEAKAQPNDPRTARPSVKDWLPEGAFGIAANLHLILAFLLDKHERYRILSVLSFHDCDLTATRDAWTNPFWRGPPMRKENKHKVKHSSRHLTTIRSLSRIFYDAVSNALVAQRFVMRADKPQFYDRSQKTSLSSDLISFALRSEGAALVYRGGHDTLDDALSGACGVRPKLGLIATKVRSRIDLRGCARLDTLRIDQQEASNSIKAECYLPAKLSILEVVCREMPCEGQVMLNTLQLNSVTRFLRLTELNLKCCRIDPPLDLSDLCSLTHFAIDGVPLDSFHRVRDPYSSIADSHKLRVIPPPRLTYFNFTSWELFNVAEALDSLVFLFSLHSLKSVRLAPAHIIEDSKNSGPPYWGTLGALRKTQDPPHVLLAESALSDPLRIPPWISVISFDRVQLGRYVFEEDIPHKPRSISIALGDNIHRDTSIMNLPSSVEVLNLKNLAIKHLRPLSRTRYDRLKYLHVSESKISHTRSSSWCVDDFVSTGHLETLILNKLTGISLLFKKDFFPVLERLEITNCTFTEYSNTCYYTADLPVRGDIPRGDTLPAPRSLIWSDNRLLASRRRLFKLQFDHQMDMADDPNVAEESAYDSDKENSKADESYESLPPSEEPEDHDWVPWL